MFKLIKPNILLVYFILLAFIYYLGSPELALLCFIMSWQAFAVFTIVKGIKQNIRVRHGVIVKGKLPEVYETELQADENGRYNVVIEFYWPTQQHRNTIRCELYEMDTSREYDVLVDVKNPGNSVLANDVKGNWLYSTLIFILFVLALVYVDYILITRM